MKQFENVVISVLAPIYNDADILGLFLEDLSALLASRFSFYEVLLVDDGSTDDTSRTIESLLKKYDRIRYLALSRHAGWEVAISAGLESTIGDFVVVLRPSTDPVDIIPELIERCRRGSGILSGISSQPRHRGPVASRASKLFHAYCRHYLGFDYREDTTHYHVLSRQSVNALTRIKDRHRFLRVFTATLGYHQEFFTYDFVERKPGASKESLWAQINSGIEIAIANSRHPLRLVSRLGLAMSFVNFLYVFYIVGVYIFKRKVAEGWTTASLQHTTMFFFLFLILAVLCEYVGRILEETQGRPLYFVSHEKSSSVLLEDSVETSIINQSDRPRAKV